MAVMIKALIGALVGFCAIPGLGFAADAPAAPAIPVVAQSPSFAGFYVGGGGGVGGAEKREFSCCDSTPGTRTFSIDGWVASAAAGYNVQFGSFLAGLEIAGRWEHVRTQETPAN